ncbi:hypothetical protein KFL_011150050 [Klebsormidium nitens]|uniref:Uncharacterized protein n=1 Tax=Klebsormidium nitens TaxID=105231 RepID=A0A1Y1IVL6_KLENI|nr:hypothetical protein KFL_011150050 [Klebsormidium nitens]|eukprot:GAQ92737.1 hypothetical protein KFL_011150050 [Klebsormidium nitens]
MDHGPLREFVSARCDVGRAVFVPRRKFREAFTVWQGGRAAPKGLPEAMDALGYKRSTRPYGPDRKNTGVYLHLTLPTGHASYLAPLASISEVNVPEDDLQLEGLLSDDAPRVSGAANPRKTWHDLKKLILDEKLEYSHHKFAGQGQTETPVTDARGAVKIINFLPGPQAARFRDVCGDIVVRFLEGDASLVEEIREEFGEESLRHDAELQRVALASQEARRPLSGLEAAHVYLSRVVFELPDEAVAQG